MTKVIGEGKVQIEAVTGEDGKAARSENEGDSMNQRMCQIRGET